MKPALIIETGHNGISRVVIQYDPGDKRAAFRLLERSSVALQELDRVVQATADEPAPAA